MFCTAEVFQGTTCLPSSVFVKPYLVLLVNSLQFSESCEYKLLNCFVGSGRIKCMPVKGILVLLMPFLKEMCLDQYL